MIYLTDDFMKRRCDVVKSGWSTKQVPIDGIFLVFQPQSNKKKKERGKGKRRKKEEKEGRERRERYSFHYSYIISKSSRRATRPRRSMANYQRCGLMGRIQWLPSERSCVDAWVPSWISSEGYYQVFLRWHDGVIYYSDNTYVEDWLRWCILAAVCGDNTVARQNKHASTRWCLLGYLRKVTTKFCRIGTTA